MVNRLPDENEEKKQRMQAEINRRINAIREHAACLYDLMEAGMTISVFLEETPNLIVPNQPPRVKRIYITRPAMALEVTG